MVLLGLAAFAGGWALTRVLIVPEVVPVDMSKSQDATPIQPLEKATQPAESVMELMARFDSLSPVPADVSQESGEIGAQAREVQELVEARQQVEQENAQRAAALRDIYARAQANLAKSPGEDLGQVVANFDQYVQEMVALDPQYQQQLQPIADMLPLLVQAQALGNEIKAQAELGENANPQVLTELVSDLTDLQAKISTSNQKIAEAFAGAGESLAE